MKTSLMVAMAAFCLLGSGCRALFENDPALPAPKVKAHNDPSPVPRPGTFYETVKHEGLERTFRFHVPRSCRFEVEEPLVFLLHGGGGTGFKMEKLTQGGFNALSENENFIAVYPDGIDKRWNDGRYDLPQDDVAFLVSLIDYFDNHYNIDRNKVYATGISNGAFMSHRLAIEVPDKFAAVAPVVGPMSENLSSLTPRKPIPILAIIGTDDPLIPWEGGEVKVLWWKRGRSVSAKATLDFWVKHNRCSAVPAETLLPDRDPDDGCRARVKTYLPEAGGAEVVFYAVEGGGHTWPGGYQYLGEWLVGPTCRDFDANRVIWDFFRKHGITGKEEKSKKGK